MDNNALIIAKKIKGIEEFLSTHVFVEREDQIKAMSLALVANTNILMLGDPGVAKSLLATEWIKHISGSNYFEWLLDPYTTPDEICGHISIKNIQEDKLVRNIENSIHNAHIAFLDEFWKTNGGVINNLLPTLNERVYFNGGKKVQSPLLTIIAASNELPEKSDHLDAALDRFVLKLIVPTIQERSNWIKMMNLYLSSNSEPRQQVSIEEIKILQEKAKKVLIDQKLLATILKIKFSIESNTSQLISPRVVNNSLRVIQANAVLNGRKYANTEDLEVLKHTFWKDPDHYNAVQSTVFKYTFPHLEKIFQIRQEAKILMSEYRALDLEKENEYAKVFTILGSFKKLKSKLEHIKATSTASDSNSKELNSCLEQMNDDMSTIFAEHDSAAL